MSEGPYVLGIDYGTESVWVGIFDLEDTPVVFAAEAYPLKHPYSGWAEQDPDEWWRCLVKATRRALDEGDVPREDIAGLSVGATTCTVVALDRQNRILRPAIMWMDVRAVDQAVRVQETEDPALKYNGFARVSAEWMPSKALWLKEREPDTYENAGRICECLDWITHRLTGEWTASINTASFRWYYDRNEGGFPESLYGALGLDDLLDKFPSRVLDMGTVASELRKEVAEELGLPAGLPVAEGGGDAFIALVGLNVLEPRKMALITGSSHVVVGQAAEPRYGAGFFGAYTDGVVPGQYSIEGGQASTGSVVKWFKDNFAKKAGAEAERRGVDPYEVLGEMAARVPPGSEELMVLDYWQGNRTPHTDPEARGMMWGLPQARRGTRLPGDPRGHLLRHRANPAHHARERLRAKGGGGLRRPDKERSLDADARGRLEPADLIYPGAGGADAGLGDARGRGGRAPSEHPHGRRKHGPRREPDRTRPGHARGVQVFRGQVHRDLSPDERADARSLPPRGWPGIGKPPASG